MSEAMLVRATAVWREWGGAWMRFTVCSECAELAYCGASRRRSPFLCLPCFDVSPEADVVIYRREARHG